ncbi:molybdenum ABC transporter, periplasmic molybdate-binding protein [Desulfosporosinus acidiphilus SJ4]|uniref:Molybdenum ABC transporter, periplasmic molybdate-binding protein n=1 Tax=Desulfosporosinus acidiphilus (strain DSM 22704 / JCM 16185 / SJ4) TaxID=646529 RepID=I4DAR2_DESAJ|nr:molybdate ABC transporter substrate-binding protein [Desulfosporosinus acidiphilus]AFM42886.1 molybdenum ABC transporter, periplasmic molybdate-binding protein [Desulfosporosinus acidiphilus SJ4]
MFSGIRKNRRSRVIWGLMSCLFIFVLFISGCSGSAKEASTSTSGSANQSKQVKLMISTAPSLKGSFEIIKGLYEAKNPGVTLTFNYGPSGSLQNQIEQGAATDIYISQGKPQMDALEQKGLIKKDSRVNLLGDELVLIVKKDNTSIKSFEDLARPDVKKIGIGEAKSVPAAKTTQETLQTLRLWDALQSKMVVGKDLMQVMAYVETGNADAGFVWDTIAITSDKVKVAATAPADSHSPVVLPAAIIASSKNSDDAAKFLAYLQSDEAMKIFNSNGFAKVK